jgi:Protein of unknown function (DUF2851)
MIYNEALLQFIWQFKLFNPQLIKVFGTDEKVEILHVGQINKDAGPDFKEGRIQVGNVTLIGDVELHIKASEWILHKHQDDERYQRIIVHVVYQADKLIQDKNGKEFICIELKDAIDIALINRYQTLLANKQSLACTAHLGEVRSITWWQQWERMLTERLLKKSVRVLEILRQTNNDWSEVFYIQLGRAFGAKVNSDAFEALVTRLPLRNIARQRDQLLQVEAMLFGSSGLLPEQSSDSYIKDLLREFQHLKIKYQLQPMDPLRWKFMRMQPANFPTVRIAQFAQFICSSDKLFSKLLEIADDPKAIKKLFQAQASTFWDTHYGFKGDEHKALPKKMGEQFQEILLINTVAPILYAYGYQEGLSEYCKNALDLIMSLPAENNNVTREFTDLGIDATNAGVSQGMIELFHEYCTLKKCLNCSIGYSIIKGGKNISL